MGIFCMIFGIVIFVAFLAFGYVFGSLMVMEGFLNVLSGAATIQMSDLFRLPGSDLPTYIVCVAIFGFLGLLMGLGLFMNGLMYRKLGKIERRVGHRSHRHHKDSQYEQ